MIKPYTTFAWEGTNSQYAVACPQIAVGDGWYGEGGTAQALLAKPAGQRALVINGYDRRLFNNPKDYLTDKTGVSRRTVWFDQGIQETSTGVEKLCQDYKAANLEPDMFVLDGEDGVNCWSTSEEDKQTFMVDPKYAALAKKWNLPLTYDQLWPNAMDFNYNMGRYMNTVAKVACWDIFKKYFPNVVFSNFGDCPISKDNSARVPEFNGHFQPIPTSTEPVFSPVLYAGVGQLGTVYDKTYITSQWKCIAWSLNIIRAGFMAVPKGKMMPWIAPKELSNVLDFSYWSEMIYHAALLCGPQFLWFNHNSNYDPTKNQWVVNQVAAKKSDTEFNYVMDEIYNAAQGKVFSDPINPNYLINYSSTAIVTQCKLEDGSILGRATFKGPPVSATSINVTVNGKVITVNKEANSPGAWFVG